MILNALCQSLWSIQSINCILGYTFIKHVDLSCFTLVQAKRLFLIWEISGWWRLDGDLSPTSINWHKHLLSTSSFINFDEDVTHLFKCDLILNFGIVFLLWHYYFCNRFCKNWSVLVFLLLRGLCHGFFWKWFITWFWYFSFTCGSDLWI